MLKENEVVMLVLGICVMILIFMNHNHTRKIRFWKLVFSSYCILVGGWLFTVAEGFIFPGLLNFLEHGSYLFSAVLILIWAWKITGSNNREETL